MGITGLIPFLEKASRRVNVDEFSGCTVAIDSYCWLHKGAFACAERLVRGEETDIHIKYCLKYVTMLLAKNIKPILVFDGRHLPAKAMTEAKRRESRDISKKRAAELLSLGKVEEARSYMRRSVDITHSMALSLIKECRSRNVDCVVAPYEADAQLAYLNIKNIAQLVITEDSDLILFGCTKVLFKMDLEGFGTLVETAKLPLVMKCPIEHYTFDKFRQMCIMSGCDYLASLPGIGLAKARQFITATQDPNIANALRKLPSYFNKANLTVTDDYRENFLKAEATFKHQYVYDPIERKMVRLNEVEDEDVETALCVNAGELLDDKTAFQLALGNIDPFSLKKMNDWHPDDAVEDKRSKSDSWKEVAKHPTIWSKDFSAYLGESQPWRKKVKKVEPIISTQTRARKKVVNLVPKYVAETQDESLTIENLSNMYCIEPASKKAKTDCDNEAFSQNKHNIALDDSEIVRELTQKDKSPILENKERSFKKCMKQNGIMQRLSRFTRTVIDEGSVVESKFFSPNSSKDEQNTSRNSIVIDESPEKVSRNPFRVKTVADINKSIDYSQSILNEGMEIDTQCSEILDTQLSSSQKENSPNSSPVKSPILQPSPRLRNLSIYKYKMDNKPQYDGAMSEDSVIENTYPLETLVTPVASQLSYGDSQDPQCTVQEPPRPLSQPLKAIAVKKSTCRVPGLKKTASLPSNQPTLLSKFGFQKKPVFRR